MRLGFALVAIIATQLINAQSPALAPVLTAYYNVKDALVSSDPADAAAKAGELLNVLNKIDISALPAEDKKAFTPLKEKLAFDARHISESKEISYQREHFASLSTNMATLANEARLSAEPVYEDYCPMKRSFWLSGGQDIKNPYFGNTMLTCGKVTATLKP